MQIYFLGLHLPKLRFDLFIHLFSMMFLVKNWGIEKLPVPSFVTPIFHIVFFCYFCLQKKRKANIYVSLLWNRVPHLFLSRRLFFPSLPFFRAVWKSLIPGCGSNNMEGRRWMVTLPRMSEIQMTSIQGATELRIIASAPLRGPSPSYCAFISFHLSAVSSRKKKQQRKVYSPTLSFYLDPLHIKLLVCRPWMRRNRKQSFTP